MHRLVHKNTPIRVEPRLRRKGNLRLNPGAEDHQIGGDYLRRVDAHAGDLPVVTLDGGGPGLGAHGNADEFMAQASAGRDLALQTIAEIDAGDRPDDQWYRDMAAPWPTLEFYVGSEFGRKVAAIANRTRWEFCSARIDGVQKFQCTMAPTAFFDRETFHAHLHDCLLYTSPSPRDLSTSRMPSSA